MAILQFVAAEYGITYIKTVGLAKLDKAENGKEFCLYMFKNEHLKNQWGEIIKVIEWLFLNNQVKPFMAPESESDKVIEGSYYIHYRNDKAPKFANEKRDKYIGAEAAKKYAKENNLRAYNVCGEEDVLVNFNLYKNQTEAKLSTTTELDNNTNVLKNEKN